MFETKPRLGLVAAALPAAVASLLAATWLIDDDTVALSTLKPFALNLSIAAMLPALAVLFVRSNIPRRRIPPRGMLAFAVLVGILLTYGFIARQDRYHFSELLTPSIGSAVILAQAAAEEILFRGVLPLVICWAWTRTRRPTAWGFGVSALLFTLFHLPATLPSALDHFLFAVLMTVLLVGSRSLLLPIIVHAANNLIVILLAPTPLALPVVATKYLLLLIAASLVLNNPARALLQKRPEGGLGRLAGMDALRGLALMIILVENALLFVPAEFNATNTTQLDRILRAIVAGFVEFRGLPLFALLIGFSLYSLTQRSGESGWRQARSRNFFFLAIGVLHGLTVFSGDVLAVFGILLALALPILNRARRLTLWTCLFGLAFVAQAAIAASLLGVSSGGYSSLTAPEFSTAALYRIIEWSGYFITSPLLSSGTLSLVFLGWLIGARLLKEGPLPRWMNVRINLFLLMASVALCIPAALDYYSSYGTSTSALATLSAQMGGAIGAIAMFNSAAQIQRRGTAPRLVGVLAPVGRATLSSYLFSSVVFLTVLSPVGLGVGAAGIPATIVVAAVVFLTAVAFASALKAYILPFERLEALWVRRLVPMPISPVIEDRVGRKPTPPSSAE